MRIVTSKNHRNQILKNLIERVKFKDVSFMGSVGCKIASILRGKHKTIFTPHLDCGDNVIVINAKKVMMTGNKVKEKKYYKHTGYPGGLKELYFKDIIKGAKPESIIKKAVERMMTSNALSKKQLSNLRIFKDEQHNLEAQKPEIIDFGALCVELRPIYCSKRIVIPSGVRGPNFFEPG